jgi:hypothetical protein
MFLAWIGIPERFFAAGRHTAESPPSGLNIACAKYCHKSGGPLRNAASKKGSAAIDPPRCPGGLQRHIPEGVYRTEREAQL